MTDLELLENVLNIRCPVILKNLQQGLNEQYMNTLLKDSSLDYNKIKEIYSWRNGLPDSMRPFASKYSFHPFGNFLSLEKALQIKSEYEKEGLLNSVNFFPVISNNDGDILWLDIDEKSPTFRFLYITSISMLIISPVTIYDSFACFVQSVSHCYSSGGYKYDKKTNEIEVDLEYERAFSNTINPRSEFWKDEE